MDSQAAGAHDAHEDEAEDRPALTVKSVEVAVAAILLAGGGLVIFDSVRLGARWGSDGPQAGYFPFYIGVILVVSGIVNLFRALRDPYTRTFLTAEQGRQVLLILLPLIVYVALFEWLWLYVAPTL